MVGAVAIMAPAVIRTPGLLMPLRTLDDLHVVKSASWGPAPPLDLDALASIYAIRRRPYEDDAALRARFAAEILRVRHA